MTAPKLSWVQNDEGNWNGYSRKEPVAAVYAIGPKGIEWTSMPFLNGIGHVAPTIESAQAAAEAAWYQWLANAGLVAAMGW